MRDRDRKRKRKSKKQNNKQEWEHDTHTAMLNHNYCDHVTVNSGFEYSSLLYQPNNNDPGFAVYASISLSMTFASSVD